MPNNEQVDLDEIMDESLGAITTRDPTPKPGAPRLPAGVDSAWSLNKLDGAKSYYAPETTWQPDAPPVPEHVDDPERAQAVAHAEMLGGGIVRRIVENMAKAARGERVPNAKPSGHCSTGDHAVDIGALSHVDRLHYYQVGQCGACRRGEKPKGIRLTLRLRWPFRRRRSDAA